MNRTIPKETFGRCSKAPMEMACDCGRSYFGLVEIWFLFCSEKPLMQQKLLVQSTDVVKANKKKHNDSKIKKGFYTLQHPLPLSISHSLFDKGVSLLLFFFASFCHNFFTRYCSLLQCLPAKAQYV